MGKFNLDNIKKYKYVSTTVDYCDIENESCIAVTKKGTVRKYFVYDGNNEKDTVNICKNCQSILMKWDDVTH
jgi:hypothetical protein